MKTLGYDNKNIWLMFVSFDESSSMTTTEHDSLMMIMMDRRWKEESIEKNEM